MVFRAWHVKRFPLKLLRKQSSLRIVAFTVFGPCLRVPCFAAEDRVFTNRTVPIKAQNGTVQVYLCVPKIRFYNIGGEGRRELGVT
jgi:hypothetical protein